MLKFYTYLPRMDGSEPKRLKNRTVFEAKSVDEAIHKARKLYGIRAKLFFYMDFFNKDTYTKIK